MTPHPLRAELDRLRGEVAAAIRVELRRWRIQSDAAADIGITRNSMFRAPRGQLPLERAIKVLERLQAATARVTSPPAKSNASRIRASAELRAEAAAEVARAGGVMAVSAALNWHRWHVGRALQYGERDRVQAILQAVRKMPDRALPARKPPDATRPPASPELIAAVTAEVARVGSQSHVSRQMGYTSGYATNALRDRSEARLTSILAFARTLPDKPPKRPRVIARPPSPPKPPPPPPPPPKPKPAPKPAPKPRPAPKPKPKPQRPYITRLADAAAGPRCTVWWGDQVLYRDPSGDVIEPAPGAPSRVSAPHGEARYAQGQWIGDPLICGRIKKIVVG